MDKLSIPPTTVQPNVDLVVINGVLWIFVGSECRHLNAADAQAVAEFTTNAADALADAL